MSSPPLARASVRSRRGLYGVLAAHAVALTGTRVSAIALPWFVLVSTDSVTKTGVVAFCEMAPYVVVKGLTGPLVDRVGPRRVSIVADVISAAAIGAVPVLHALGLLHFGVLLALVAVVGAFRGPGDSAKEVFLPTVAEDAQVPLERATGLSGTIERLASTVGPGVAGVVVASFGSMNAIALNAVTFLLGAVIIGATVRRGGEPAHDGDVDSYLRRLGEGLSFLRRDKLLRSVVGMVAATNLLDAAMFAVLLPVWARSSGYGAAEIGAIGSAFGALAVCGSLIAAGIAHRLPRRRTYLIGFLLAGAPRFVVLALEVPFVVVLAVMALSGFGAGFINPILGAVFFERVPRHLLGRVNALGDSLAWAGIPFGGLVGAAMIGLVGLAPALLVAGAAYLVATTLPALQPAWAQMDRTRARPSPNSGPADERQREPAAPLASSPPGALDPLAASSTSSASSSASSAGSSSTGSSSTTST